MDSPRSVVLLTGRHRPHEQLLLAWGAVSGATYLSGVAPSPTSLTAVMPTYVVKAWALGLVMSGVVGLIGCWRRGERGLWLEAGGLLLGIGSLLLYTSAAIAFAGLVRSLFVVGIVGAWMVANVVRVVQIRSDLRSFKRVT